MNVAWKKSSVCTGKMIRINVVILVVNNKVVLKLKGAYLEKADTLLVIEQEC